VTPAFYRSPAPACRNLDRLSRRSFRSVSPWGLVLERDYREGLERAFTSISLEPRPRYADRNPLHAQRREIGISTRNPAQPRLSAAARCKTAVPFYVRGGYGSRMVEMGAGEWPTGVIFQCLAPQGDRKIAWIMSASVRSRSDKDPRGVEIVNRAKRFRTDDKAHARGLFPQAVMHPTLQPGSTTPFSLGRLRGGRGQAREGWAEREPREGRGGNHRENDRRDCHLRE